MDLNVSDTREDKFELVFELSGRLDLLPPVYIISHKRPHNLKTLKTIPMLSEHATLVVAEEEAWEYDLAGHGNILTIPPGYAGLDIGVGRARQFVLDTAAALEQDHILLLDDDLESLSLLYSIGSGKVSHAYARLVGEEGREDFYLGLLVLTALCAEEAYAAHPEAVIASPQCNNANRTPASSETRWELNRGGPPAQIQSWRVDRFFARHPEGLDLERFNRHGDDIGVACQVITEGGAIVNIPSVIGQYLDYETESVIRNEETAPALREAEHAALMSHPMAPYVKTRTDFLDRPQWHSLDWRKLRKDGKVEDASRTWDHGLIDVDLGDLEDII